MAENTKTLFEELESILTEFKKFLDENVPTIKPAIQALAALIPEIVKLLDLLIGLMADLKAEINNLDVSDISGLDKASEFTAKVKNLLEASKNLLTDQADTIGEVLSVVEVVSGLTALTDEFKKTLTDLIDEISDHLVSLKPA